EQLLSNREAPSAKGRRASGKAGMQAMGVRFKAHTSFLVHYRKKRGKCPVRKVFAHQFIRSRKTFPCRIRQVVL
ncbi:MAG: hypothetical protein IIX35_05140, partial [Paraprevotella sp.]|nr:hypothetical protein [Paraprevotella sp.]